jgi:hypothetical protein
MSFNLNLSRITLAEGEYFSVETPLGHDVFLCFEEGQLVVTNQKNLGITTSMLVTEEGFDVLQDDSPLQSSILNLIPKEGVFEETLWGHFEAQGDDPEIVKYALLGLMTSRRLYRLWQGGRWNYFLPGTGPLEDW